MNPNATSTNWQRPLIVSGSVVLVIAALYFARAVLIPVVLAALLTFVLSPLVSALQWRGLGRLLSTLIVVTMAFSLLAALAALVVIQLKNLIADLPQYKDNILAKITSLQESSKSPWIDQVADTVGEISRRIQDALGGPMTGSEPDPVPVRIETSGWDLIQASLGPVLEVLVTIGLVIVLVTFMLIKREDLRNRLIRLLGFASLAGMTKALDDAGHRISRFLLMQVIVNATYGLALAVGLFFIGVPYAFLWGLLAAVIRYIPYLGPMVGAIFPLLLSVAVLPGWTQPLLVLGYIVVLELVSNDVMEPWLYGRSIGVSEVALLVAAAFWTWLWGPMGLLLSTPMTACLVVLGRYVPFLNFFAVLLGDEPVLQPHVTFFQRLLAKDEDEASVLVEDYLKTHSREQAYQSLLLPALTLCKQNRLRGELSEADEQYVLRAIREIVEEVDTAEQEARQQANLPDAAPTANAGTTGANGVASSADAIGGRRADSDGSGEPVVLVLGCPAQDEAEEIALQMFANMLHDPKCRFEVLAAETLAGELVERVRGQRPAAVCIGTLPPRRLAHTRYLCKRLRTGVPGLQILVGCWGLEQDVEAVCNRIRQAGADKVGSTLSETCDQLRAIVSLEEHAHPPASKSSPSGAADRTAIAAIQSST